MPPQRLFKDNLFKLTKIYYSIITQYSSYRLCFQVIFMKRHFGLQGYVFYIIPTIYLSKILIPFRA